MSVIGQQMSVHRAADEGQIGQQTSADRAADRVSDRATDECPQGIR